MFVDFEWIAGLVFGLDTNQVSMMEEGSTLSLDEPQSTCINLYLGLAVIHLIF